MQSPGRPKPPTLDDSTTSRSRTSGVQKTVSFGVPGKPPNPKGATINKTQDVNDYELEFQRLCQDFETKSFPERAAVIADKEESDLKLDEDATRTLNRLFIQEVLPEVESRSKNTDGKPSKVRTSSGATFQKVTNLMDTSEVDKQAIHTFEPGAMELDYDNQGTVKKVRHDGQAFAKGVLTGDQILKVGTEKFSFEAVRRAETSEHQYEVTFKVSNKRNEALERGDKICFCGPVALQLELGVGWREIGRVYANGEIQDEWVIEFDNAGRVAVPHEYLQKIRDADTIHAEALQEESCWISGVPQELRATSNFRNENSLATHTHLEDCPVCKTAVEPGPFRIPESRKARLIEANQHRPPSCFAWLGPHAAASSMWPIGCMAVPGDGRAEWTKALAGATNKYEYDCSARFRGSNPDEVFNTDGAQPEGAEPIVWPKGMPLQKPEEFTDAGNLEKYLRSKLAPGDFDRANELVFRLYGRDQAREGDRKKLLDGADPSKEEQRKTGQKVEDMLSRSVQRNKEDIFHKEFSHAVGHNQTDEFLKLFQRLFLLQTIAQKLGGLDDTVKACVTYSRSMGKSTQHDAETQLSLTQTQSIDNETMSLLEDRNHIKPRSGNFYSEEYTKYQPVSRMGTGVLKEFPLLLREEDPYNREVPKKQKKSYNGFDWVDFDESVDTAMMNAIKSRTRMQVEANLFSLAQGGLFDIGFKGMAQGCFKEAIDPLNSAARIAQTLLGRYSMDFAHCCALLGQCHHRHARDLKKRKGRLRLPAEILFDNVDYHELSHTQSEQIIKVVTKAFSDALSIAAERFDVHFHRVDHGHDETSTLPHSTLGVEISLWEESEGTPLTESKLRQICTDAFEDVCNIKNIKDATVQEDYGLLTPYPGISCQCRFVAQEHLIETGFRHALKYYHQALIVVDHIRPEMNDARDEEKLNFIHSPGLEGSSISVEAAYATAQMGFIYSDLKDWTAAKSHFERSVLIMQSNWGGLSQALDPEPLAFVLEEVGRLRLKDDHDRKRPANSQSFDLLHGRPTNLESLNQFEVEGSALAILVEHGLPGQVGLLCTVGGLYGLHGEYDAAIKFLERAMSRIRDRGDVMTPTQICRKLCTMFNLTIAYSRKGRSSDAKRMLEKTLNALKENKADRNSLAYKDILAAEPAIETGLDRSTGVYFVLKPWTPEKVFQPPAVQEGLPPLITVERKPKKAKSEKKEEPSWISGLFSQSDNDNEDPIVNLAQ